MGFGLFLAFVAGLNWLLPKLVRPSPAPIPQKNQIDEYMLGAKAIRFDKTGKIVEKLNIEGVYHIQGEDFMSLRFPELALHRDNLLWTIKANSGKSFHSKEHSFERIDLKNHVEINVDQDAPNNWRMQTDSLSIFPLKELVVSDAPVSIFSGNLLIESQGVHGDLKLGLVDLKKEVTSYYEMPTDD